MEVEEQQVGITVPFFCEWIFEKNLSSSDEYENSSLYSYIVKRVEAEGAEDFLLSTPKYPLPGFPGIKYYIDLNWVQHADDDDNKLEELFMDFNVQTDYKNHEIHADFVQRITGCEDKHVVKTWNQETFDNGLAFFPLLSCFNNCNCPVCKDKKFVIRIEGTLTVNHVDALPLGLKVSASDFPEAEEDKDFVIVAEDQEILFHKSVLIKHSAVFAKMFESNNWTETIENKMAVPDFPHKIVEIVINALYGRTYDKPLQEEEYLLLLKFADKYDMEKFQKAVADSIVLTPDNVVNCANFFFLQGYCIEVVNRCIDYILFCSQYSLPAKDIVLLDTSIRAMFFDRAIVNPVFKKNPKLEHRNFNDEF